MELATRFFSLAKLSKPSKTTTPKQEHKLPVRQEVTVKLTPKELGKPHSQAFPFSFTST